MYPTRCLCPDYVCAILHEQVYVRIYYTYYFIPFIPLFQSYSMQLNIDIQFPFFFFYSVLLSGHLISQFLLTLSYFPIAVEMVCNCLYYAIVGGIQTHLDCGLQVPCPTKRNQGHLEKQPISGPTKEVSKSLLVKPTPKLWDGSKGLKS